MELQNEKQHNTACDSAYGGGKYRLSYDAKENKRVSSDNTTPNLSRPIRLFTWLVFALVFIVIGAFILSYYNSEVKKIFGHSDKDTPERISQEYSNVNVVTD